MEREVAEGIDFDEAEEILSLANRYGLVHKAIYSDWIRRKVFICNCYPCCCMYLRTLLNYGIEHHVARSGLIAEVDGDRCTGCGLCLQRCVFNARVMEGSKSKVVRESCYGCGLCFTTCSSGATKLSPNS